MDGREVLRKGVAEAFGTGLLIFGGAGSIIAVTFLNAGSLLTIALAHGLALGIGVTAVGHISGGHLNPAVTFGAWVTRQIDTKMAAVYWFFQLLGATVAALVLSGIFPDEVFRLAQGGAPTVSSAISLGEAFLAEAAMTFFLVFVVFATAIDPRGAFKAIAGFAIGLTIAVDILVGGPLTGAAMTRVRPRAGRERLVGRVALLGGSARRRGRRGAHLPVPLPGAKRGRRAGRVVAQARSPRSRSSTVPRSRVNRQRPSSTSTSAQSGRAL